MPTTCANVEHGTCTSVQLHEPFPDMSLGDICVLCVCWECERCTLVMDLDAELQIKDGHGGFVAVCDECLTAEDVLYDPELETERQLEAELRL